MFDNVILTFDYNSLLEISEILIVSDVFFDFKFHQIRFLSGFRPDPAEELIQRSPRPLVGWGGEETPLLIPLSLFGIELSRGAPVLWSA